MKTIDLITMIYKSKDYLDLIIDEMIKTKVPDDWQLNLRVIANDPEQDFKQHLLAKFFIGGILDIEFYNDPKPNDYYLNRVYRCWNHAGFNSKADAICFVNSDMMFSKDWLINLLKHHDGNKIPCSRLVESGKLLSGTYGISRNFGIHPKSLDKETWLKFAEENKKSIAPYGGLYMPCIFETSRFIEAGGYPEGNIYADGPGTLNGPVFESGDTWFFKKLEKEYKMKHVTVFDSLVYHIQEGEKDE